MESIVREREKRREEVVIRGVFVELIVLKYTL